MGGTIAPVAGDAGLCEWSEGQGADVAWLKLDGQDGILGMDPGASAAWQSCR